MDLKRNHFISIIDRQYLLSYTRSEASGVWGRRQWKKYFVVQTTNAPNNSCPFSIIISLRKLIPPICMTLLYKKNTVDKNWLEAQSFNLGTMSHKPSLYLCTVYSLCVAITATCALRNDNWLYPVLVLVWSESNRNITENSMHVIS